MVPIGEGESEGTRSVSHQDAYPRAHGTDGTLTALNKEQYESGTSGTSKKGKEKKAADDKVRNELELSFAR